MDPFNPNGTTVEPLQSGASESPPSGQSLQETNNTTKEASIQVIACRQCRSRKVKCDSGRPLCKNCTRRGDPCEYDETPKRRGPDKQPGARHRMYKKKPTEGHTVSGSEPSAKRVKKTSSAEPLAERRVSRKKSAIANGQALTGGVDTSQSKATVSTLVVPSEDPALATLPNQESQVVSTLYPPGVSLNDVDLDMSIRAAGFTSLEKLLRMTEQELTFPTPEQIGMGPFALNSMQPITSISDIPQHWSRNIPPSIYQAAHGYYDSMYTAQTSYIPRGPSGEFYRETWWESLLPLYSTDTSQGVMRIYQDLNFLLNNAIYWFSFINLPWFMDSLFDPSRRATMQPSVVLSALAFATLMKSSEIGLGKEGRKFADWLRDAAQSSLEASLNVSWIEPSLAQAAFFLVLYEASSHPKHTSARTVSALRLLDSLIQALNLTRIDAHEIEATTFAANDIPSLASSSSAFYISEHGTSDPANETAFVTPIGTTASRCNCGATLADARTFGGAYVRSTFGRGAGFYGATYGRTPMSLSRDAQQFSEQEGLSTLYYMQNGGGTNLSALGEPSSNKTHWKKHIMPTEWPDPRDPGEMQKEESRRLCWSSIVLFSALAEYSPHFGAASPDFFVTKQENLALFFPGEAIVKWKAKESIFALHCRAALLWNACNRLRLQNGWQTRRAELIGKAWLEANDIENALARHTCPLGEGVLFAGREYLFQLKMMISNNFTRLIPLPHTLHFERDSAKEWLSHREIIATHVRKLAYFVTRFGASATALALSKRPLSVWWAMYQIQAGLLVWKSDTTIDTALKQSLDFLAIADFLTVMWPSEQQGQRYAAIRTDLLNACAMAGIKVPTPVPIPGLPEGVTGTMIPSPFFSNKPSASDILMAPLD